MVSASASALAYEREKNFNLGHNFLTRSDKAFILHMCIACDKTFLHGNVIFYLVTSTFKFDFLLKNMVL